MRLEKKVAVIERSKAMYGGTCINIACIPTKTMIVAAEKGWSFDDTMKERGAVTGRLNAKNYKCWPIMALMSLMQRHFVSNKVIEIQAGDEKTRNDR